MGVLGIVGGNNPTGYGRYEPKRQWQWVLDVSAMVGGSKLYELLSKAGVKDSLTISVISIPRPSVSFNEISINHGNEQWKLAGKTSWASSNIDVVFHDVIPATQSGAGDSDPLYSVSAIMYEWLNIIQDVVTGNGSLSADYKANLIVTQFNPAGEAIERFLYHGAFPLSLSGDGWQYEGEGIVTRTVSFAFDKYFRLSIKDSTTTPPSEIFGTSDEE